MNSSSSVSPGRYMPSMKSLIFYLSLISLASCGETAGIKPTSIPKSKSWAFTLADSLTKIKMNLPQDFDTVFLWTHNICGIPYYKLRIQDSSYQIHEEGGFYDTEIPKEKKQITFIQQPFSGKSEIPTNEIIAARHKQQVLEADRDPQTAQTQFDTLVMENQKLYSIFENCLRPIKDKEYIQTFQTELYSKRGTIKVIIEQTQTRLPLDRTKFINFWIDIIKSIRVDDGI
jgi:hypothetical protein